MNLLITICDIVACITTITGLLLVTRHYKWWILYTVSNIFYIIVTIHSRLIGLTILGIVLFFVGMKNYIVERRKYNANR